MNSCTAESGLHSNYGISATQPLVVWDWESDVIADPSTSSIRPHLSRVSSVAIIHTLNALNQKYHHEQTHSGPCQARPRVRGQLNQNEVQIIHPQLSLQLPVGGSYVS